MTTTVPTNAIAHQKRTLELALEAREAESAHRLLEHVGASEATCLLCRIGLDPLTIGDLYDSVLVEIERSRLTALNRERQRMEAQLTEDISSFEWLMAS